MQKNKKTRSKAPAARNRFLFTKKTKTKEINQTFDGVRVISTVVVPEPHQVPGYLSAKHPGVPEDQRRYFDVHLDARNKVIVTHARHPISLETFGLKSQFYSLLRKLILRISGEKILQHRFGTLKCRPINSLEPYFDEELGKMRQRMVHNEIDARIPDTDEVGELSDDWKSWTPEFRMIQA